jgi:glycogen operon protein
VIAILRGHEVLRRPKFFQGRHILGTQIKDLAWFGPTGVEMSPDAWRDRTSACLGMRLAREPEHDDEEAAAAANYETLLILLNAQPRDVDFTLPPCAAGTRWDPLLDTARAGDAPLPPPHGASYRLEQRSVVVLRLEGEPVG